MTTRMITWLDQWAARFVLGRKRGRESLNRTKGVKTQFKTPDPFCPSAGC